MHKTITDVLDDKDCGFFAETKGEFETWLKGLMGDDYKPPTTSNDQVAWDAHWQKKLKEN